MYTVSAYFSHSIRGQAGKDASDEVVKKNCEVAKQVAAWIRETVPEIKLYVPAEHEDFVGICWRQKYLTEEQILEIDCKILEWQDFHIVYVVDGWQGGGIGIEITAAKKYSKCIFYLTELDKISAILLRQMVTDVIAMKEKDENL